MDKFVGILRINPSPLAREHDFNGHGNKEPEYLSYEFINYFAGMGLAETMIPEGKEACFI